MKVIIDRFEGCLAICEQEDGSLIKINKNKIPANAREGDLLLIEGEFIKINFKETEKKKREVEKLFNELVE